MRHRHVAQQCLAAKKNATQLAVRAGIEPRGVRSGQFLDRRLSHWTKASAKTYVKMFEGPVTGNIPEVLDNGEVTEGTHVTAGQLALALTPYAQVADLPVNTAASGNNADCRAGFEAGQQRTGAQTGRWPRRRRWTSTTSRSWTQPSRPAT